MGIERDILKNRMSISKNGQIHLTIIYDNIATKEPFQADWGFSCFVQGFEKSILFDTGKEGDILLGNMKNLEISPHDIDLVLLSHYHKDHTGGLSALLELNPNIEVWLPKFFPIGFKERVSKNGNRLVEVERQLKICDGAFTTGVIEGWIKEQSLVLDTASGLVVITGCAHPRLINILPRIKELFGRDIHMLLGGFHLTGFQTDEIREVIAMLEGLHIQKICPCHCTGDKARSMFTEKFAEDFIKAGAGKEIFVG
jgi:7,8-dihydropterin-6-yl-methyl-4-(beta-D-ribofuranosyl)aminobenzene 5'-phosphate synthase